MKVGSRLLSVLMSLALAFGLCPALAYAAPGGDGPAGLAATALLSPQADTIASGVWGTCPWEITVDGTLTIGAGMAGGAESVPWSGYSDSVTSVVTSGRVVLPENCYNMFNYYENLVTADLSGFDTSGVMNMHGMFSMCRSLKSLDLGGWDTSKVTGMGDMFWMCSSLEALDVTGFDTSGVEDMYAMFAYCSSLKSLDLSDFNTSNAANMLRMFEGCRSLEELDLSSFDTSSAASMRWTFNHCFALRKLTVGGKFSFTGGSDEVSAILPGVSWHSEAADAWFTPEEIADTRSNIADTYTRPADQDVARGMWGTCDWTVGHDFVLTIGPGIGSDIEMYEYAGNVPWAAYNAYITAVKTTGEVMLPAQCPGLFAGCGRLKALDGSGFDTSDVVDMSSMFRNCGSLESVGLSGFNTSKVENMSGMFFNHLGENPPVLKVLDLSSFDTSKVMDMGFMFAECSALESIFVGAGWSTQNVSTSTLMFMNCKALVGGKGTVYDESHVDAEYARIDAAGAPGYLTLERQAGVPGSDEQPGQPQQPAPAQQEQQPGSGQQQPVIGVQDIAGATVTGVAPKTYTGAALTQSPTVSVDGKVLAAGTDYELSYADNVKAGTATMTVTGNGSYTGAKAVTFTIAKANVKGATAAKVKARKYRKGKAVKPSPKITFKGKTLKKGTDYTLAYKNNKKRGTATITVKGKGNFKGMKVVKFKIK